MKRALLAEALGTFGLVAAGCGAILVDALGGGLGTLGIALAFGFAVALLATVLGPASGGHFNPAVSLGLAAAGRFPWRRVAPYAAAQLLGAVLGALALRAALGPVASLGATRLLRGLSPTAGLAIEVAATSLLVLAVLAPPRGVPTAWAAGAAVFLDALVAGPLTMASMNPARSLGPALVSGATSDLWLYLLAPFAGALLAVAVHEALRPRAPRGVPAPRPDAAAEAAR